MARNGDNDSITIKLGAIQGNYNDNLIAIIICASSCVAAQRLEAILIHLDGGKKEEQDRSRSSTVVCLGELLKHKFG